MSIYWFHWFSFTALPAPSLSLAIDYCSLQATGHIV